MKNYIIDRKERVMLGGLKQTNHIWSASRDHPVLLLLHGCPGVPNRHGIGDTIYATLEMGAVIAASAIEELLVLRTIPDGGVAGISSMINNLGGISQGITA